uniref:uncharacterized protein LOC120334012 n=1 Tax=Styela clava TaxID=7725 RepID=UPI001939E067|nr:uncharacterized protein LOC120334012 [Styela clava]
MVGRKRARRSCSYCKARNHNVRTCGVKALAEKTGERKLLQWLATSNDGNPTEATYDNVEETETFTENNSTRQVGTRHPVFGDTVRDLLPTTAPSPCIDGLRDGSFQNSGGMVWLQQVCHLNNFHLLNNSGGGDCAYISILDGMGSLGLPNKPYDVVQFRSIVADELGSRPHIYRDLLETDADDRNSEFNTFVFLTRSSREWAQTCCFYAIAALFPITIRLWDDRTKHFGSFGTFSQVVNIGYLSNELHYVALLPSLISAANARAYNITSCFLGREQTAKKRKISSSSFSLDRDESIEAPPKPQAASDFLPNFTSHITSTNRIHQRAERPDKPEYPSNLRGNVQDNRKCANCYRNDTAKYNINLGIRSQVSGKKYGTIKPKSTVLHVLLCDLCYKYLTSTFKSTRNSWFCSWPSVLWSILSFTGPDRSISHKVWSVLPNTIRDMWRGVELNSTSCRFLDRTHDIDKFNSFVGTHDIGYIKEAFNTYPVADVICPLGCWEFLEDCDYIPFLHYLTDITDLKLSGADPDTFRGARPDWPPLPTRYLESYICAAGICVSDEHGICILWCKDRHDSLKRPTIHPPTNPVLRPNAEQGCEFLAPCTLIPHIKRLGKIKKWNSSGHVIDVRGGHFGMSSCSLNPNPSKMNISQDHHKVNSLIVGQRHDIRKRLFEDQNKRRDAESYLFTYNVHRREKSGLYDEDIITKHLSSGTKCVTRVTDDFSNPLSSELQDAELLLIAKPPASRNRHSSPPHQFMDRHLLMLLSSKHGNAFRWDQSMGWWLVDDTKMCKCHVIPHLPSWQLAIYGVTSNAVDEEHLSRSLDGQRHFKCGNTSHHAFLMKESRNTCKQCFKRTCSNKAVWGCHWSHLGTQCNVGICRTHFMSEMRNGEVVEIQAECEYNRTPSAVSMNEGNDTYYGNTDNHSVDNEDLSTDEEYNNSLTTLHHSNMDFINDESLSDPLHTLSTNLPSFTEKSAIFPLHFLLNDTFQVLKRCVRRRKNARSHNILHHFAGNSDSTIVSLLFPEAQILPTTFWGMKNNSPVGAMHQAHLCNSKRSCTCRSLRSKDDMIGIRIRDHNLPTSQQHSNLHFYFDLKLNDKLNHNSSALVFRRGLEHIAENKSLHCLLQDSPLPYDESDSNVKIRELTALTTKYPWKYWMTMTCNELRTPGIMMIIKSMKNISEYRSDYPRIYNSNMNMINRMWLRFVNVFLKYLVNSPDQPAGPIKHMFARLEFQSTGSPGNKAHVHIGAALFDESEETTLNRISCNPETVFNDEKFGVTRHQLLQKGIVENSSDFDDLKKLYLNLSTHDCSRAGERCMKRKNDKGELVCRVPRHPTSFQYFFQEKRDLYCPDMMERMQKIGFADTTECQQPDGSVSTRLIMTDPRLRGGRYHYPTTRPPTFLPTIPLLQCALGSSFNCTACDRRFATSYLIKYHVGKESHSGRKYMKGLDKGNIKVLDGELDNVKISGQQILHNKINNNDNLKGLAVTEIGYYEMNTFINDANYTTSTADFIHVNTNPPEYRAWRVKRNKAAGQHRTYGMTGGRSAFVDFRLADNFPHWRRFTVNQQLHAREYLDSDFNYSNTEKYNIRPPELLSVNKLLIYHEIFIYTGHRLSESNFHLSSDPMSGPFYDACGHEVKIRISGIHKLRNFLTEIEQTSENVDDHHIPSRNFLKNLLKQLLSEKRPDSQHFSKIFVHDKTARETVAVNSYIYPDKKINFLYHLAITLGCYDSEFDLFRDTNSFREVFVRARLLPRKADYNQQDANFIFKIYMDAEGLHLPITRKKLERLTKLADEIITEIVCGSGEIISTTPPISELAIRLAADEEIQTIENVRRRTLVESIRNALVYASVANLPTTEEVFNANLEQPLQHWITDVLGPTSTSLIPRSDHQSNESYLEQLDSFMTTINALRVYMSPEPHKSAKRFPCIVGPPGAGKTFLIQLAAFVAMCLGFRVTLLSLTSERARALGGIHIHQAFPIPVTNKYNKSPGRTYSQMMLALRKYGKKMVLLQRTDIFIFEEIGLISAEVYAMLDRCMKDIMSSDESFGHKFVIANGDPCQLPPPQGAPFWTSIHFTASFNSISLEHFVRSASDVHLQKIITLIRQSSLQEEQIQYIVSILGVSCNFVEKWDEVPEEAMRIVSTRRAEQMAISEFLKSKSDDPNVELKKFVAIDEVYDGASWGSATTMQSNQITRQVLEPKEIFLFKGSVLRLTYNNNFGNTKFSQGQLCVVENFEETNDVNTEVAVRVKLVPPGERCLSNIDSNWKDFILKPRYTADVLLSGMTHARRLQLPIRFYKANTIHRVMGETCQLVATEINNEEQQKRHLRLWEKSQVLVLLSRVPTLSCLFFVGNRSTTLGTLTEILHTEDYWTTHINERLLSNATCPSTSMSNCNYPYSFSAREIPAFKSGVVYLLVSLPFPNVSYLGQTGRNIKRRIAEHNAGNGTTFTSQAHYMPWVPLAIIYGFSDDISELDAERQRRHVERTIHLHVQRHSTPETVLSVMMNVVKGNIDFEDRMHYYDNLVVERLGKLRLNDNNGLVATENT